MEEAARSADDAPRVGDRLRLAEPGGRDHETHDLGEAERHDREVVAAKAQARQTDDEPEEPGDRGRGEDADRHNDERVRERRVERGDGVRIGGVELGRSERVVQVRAHDRAGVRAECDEAGVPDRELTGHSVDDVQRERSEDVHRGDEQEVADRAVGDDPLHAEVEREQRTDHDDRDEQAPKPHSRRFYSI